MAGEVVGQNFGLRKVTSLEQKGAAWVKKLTTLQLFSAPLVKF
jgi:hypothetical protein